MGDTWKINQELISQYSVGPQRNQKAIFSCLKMKTQHITDYRM